MTHSTDSELSRAHETLDPADWNDLRAIGHRMLDDMIDHIASVRDRPVWTRMPAELRTELQGKLPAEGGSLQSIYEDFQRLVLPYALGNVHPGFHGWVHGGGTAVGMLAEMLAAGLNANLGGRDHAPILIEREVIRWAAEMLGLPPQSSGILVSSTSVATLAAVLVARVAAIGESVRQDGVGGAGLMAYASTATHSCVTKALDMAGIGAAALRKIGADADERIDSAALEAAIRSDRAAGLHPFLIVATAGTVGIGGYDDLRAVSNVASRCGVWLHVDAAFGAWTALSSTHRSLVDGIGEADSVAFDYHKWGQVPYDAACLVVRDPELHRRTFAVDASYLKATGRGLAAGDPWPCDFGPDLSRGFRALKIWFTLRAYGSKRLGEMVDRSFELARLLADAVRASPELELVAPAPSNIVCFRYAAAAEWRDRINDAIVAELHERGISAPNAVSLGGKLAMRAAIVNHRTNRDDVMRLHAAVLTLGARISAGMK